MVFWALNNSDASFLVYDIHWVVFSLNCLFLEYFPMTHYIRDNLNQAWYSSISME